MANDQASDKLREASHDHHGHAHAHGDHDHDHHHDHHDHDHHGHSHDHDHHDHEAHDHDHDDHEPGHGHDHSHGDGTVITFIRIGVAVVFAFILWFNEAVFFQPGTFLFQLHDWASSLEQWPVLALGDLLPAFIRNALPTGVVQWIDYYASLPFSVYGYAGLIFSGWPIFKEAFEALKERRMTMELSMAIAIVAGAYTGFFFVTMFITAFVLFAEWIEGKTIEGGRRAIRELLEFLPRNVTVRRDGQMKEIDVDELRIGETVLVAPGGLIPVDGGVVGGHSYVDESRITGESMPAEKHSGGHVFAGSINQSGVLEVRTDRIGADTSYGKIIEAVERAERSRAPITKIADQLSGLIVIFAMGFAAFTQFMWHDATQSLSVLVVAGACGIAAGVPLALLGAIGRSAKLGAIVKGGKHMEMLSRVNMVVLDKTGTLTFGRPAVREVAVAPGATREALLAAAATAEVRSEHPLGKAIVDYVRTAGESIAEPDGFAYTPGRGIAATSSSQKLLVGNESWMKENGISVDGVRLEGGAASNVYVAGGGKFLGVIAVADVVRPEARAAIQAMHKMRIRTLLLTGDNAVVAEAVAKELGIAEFEAEMLPEAKLERVTQLVASGKKVAMVGDGVNDAPALAAASVGVAMGSGTDVARESADVVLLGNDLSRFVDTLKVGRWVRRVVYQNFICTILVDVVGIILAFKGIIGPFISVNIHTVSELILILNAARLLPRRMPFSRREPAEVTAAKTAVAPAE